MSLIKLLPGDLKATRKHGKTKASELPIEVMHQMECKVCPLTQECQRVPAFGDANPVVYVLGEAPGTKEIELGRPFVGPSGELLREHLPKDVTIRFGNVARGLPRDKHAPTFAEQECCRPYTVREIEQHRPRVVLAVGGVATAWVLRNVDGATVTNYRGRCVPVQIGSHACYAYFILHPAFVLRSGGDYRGDRGPSPAMTTFRIDLERLCELLPTLAAPQLRTIPLITSPTTVYRGIECIRSKSGGVARVQTELRRLAELGKDEVVAIDIETTALRPYNGGRILSMAFASSSKTIAFPLHHGAATWSPQHVRACEDAVRDFFRTVQCRVVAHNLGFELEWLGFFYGTDWFEHVSWDDTQAAAYFLDERKNSLSLNNALFQRYGFLLKEFAAVNVEDLAHEAIDDVLLYNGGDAKWTAKLLLDQTPELQRQRLVAAYRRQVRATLALVKAQLVGLLVDEQTLQETIANVTSDTAALYGQFDALQDVKKYKAKFGGLNIKSPKQLGLFFGEFLNLPIRDESGKLKTDEATLGSLKHPAANMVLELRTLEKLKNTYLLPLVKGSGDKIHADGRIHTVFNQVFTATGRLSSDSPNVQNFPQREHSFIRRVIQAPPDHALVKADYGQIEARVIAMVSQDAKLVDLIARRQDIHMDWAERLIELCPWKLDEHVGEMKKVRAAIKNGLVFPVFYGAGAPKVAQTLSIPLRPAESLVHELKDAYPGVMAWQKRVIAYYHEHGGVRTPAGRMRRGVLSINQIINTPIQSGASDIVVAAMTRLSRVAQTRGLYLQPILNIHDDLSFYIPKVELKKAVRLIAKEMVRPRFKFVTVPLSVEIAAGDNWADMQEIGVWYTDDFTYERKVNV